MKAGSQTATMLSSSISRILFILSIESTMPAKSGTALPARPEPAPRGVPGMCSLFASFINCTLCSSFSALTTTSGLCENCFPPSSYEYDSIFSASVRTCRSPKIFLNSPKVSGVTFLYSMSTSSFTTSCFVFPFTTSCFAFPEFLDQGRQDFKRVSHDAKIAHLEDWSIRVIVDGHANISRTHAGNVLDCTGNPSCDI